MTRLPIVDFPTMEKVLLSLSFQAVRQKGSHVFYRHPDGRTTTLPNHPGRDLASSPDSRNPPRNRTDTGAIPEAARKAMRVDY